MANKNTNTITGKSTKAELAQYIVQSMKQVKDENLLSRISYTLKGVQKDEKSVAKSDLYELAKEIMGALTAPVASLAPVENSPKPAPKLGKKKSAPAPVENKPEVKEEVKETAKTAETVPEKKAPAKKTGAKAPVGKSKNQKSKEQKPKVETADQLVKGTLPLAKIFPKEIDHESLGKLIACPDKYSTVQEIREALDNGTTLIFAAYWTKRHIKQMGYAQMFNVPVPKDGFPYDLDTLQALYVCEGIDRIYALSTYTEAMFEFMAEDLVRTEVEGNDGSKFFMRYSAGMEFEIYEAVETEAE